MSAYSPPTTDTGHAALIPTKSLKTSNAGQFGARAQAIVKIVNEQNVAVMIFFLPYVSLRGPKSKGPKT